MELSIEQQMAVETNAEKVLVISCAGAGKAQPNWTKIPTPNGWTTLGEIKVGDFVFDRYGNPTKVLGVFPQGIIDCYKVTLSDGRSTYCNNEHIWSCYVNDGKSNKLKEYTVTELLEKGLKRESRRSDGRVSYSCKFKIPFQKPVNYPQKSLNIDPYVLGCFLGDGCCMESPLTISSSDEELVSTIAERIKGKYQKLPANNYSWIFYDGNGDKIRTKEFFKDYLNELVKLCDDKFIPRDYLESSIEQRMELLQGLMDTDGSISCNENRYHCAYTTISEKLKNTFCELLGSLGYKFHVREDVRQGKYKKTGKAFSILINIANNEKPKLFKLSRKKKIAEEAAKITKRTKYDRIAIKSIEKMPAQEEMTCIYVDNKEHLYLTNDFIVTHNTRVLTERAKYLLLNGVKPSELILITYTNNAAQEMKDRLSDCPGFDKVSIGTIHSYAAQLLSMNKIGLDNILERAREDDDFDSLFREVKKHLNTMFIPTIDHLLIDEFQDVAPQEYEFIKTILKPHHFFAVGDPRQMIYSFKGSSKEVFNSLYNDPQTKIFELTENYRSRSGILKVAQQAIKDLDEAAITDVVPMKRGMAEVTSMAFDIPAVAYMLKERGDYKDWFVLARSNKLVAEIAAEFDALGVPYVNFRQAEKTTEEIHQLMDENVVKLLTIHSAKGLESKNVVLFENFLGNNRYSQEARDEERRIRYVGITRAEDKLVLVKQKRAGRARMQRPTNFDYARGFGF